MGKKDISKKQNSRPTSPLVPESVMSGGGDGNIIRGTAQPPVNDGDSIKRALIAMKMAMEHGDMETARAAAWTQINLIMRQLKEKGTFGAEENAIITTSNDLANIHQISIGIGTECVILLDYTTLE